MSLCLLPLLMSITLSHASVPLTKEEAAKAEATALDAKFKFKAGKYDAAAPLFLQAFALSRKPALLYNAARAYEEAGKHAEARVAFEQYLSQPDLTDGGRKDANTHIQQLDLKIAAANKAREEKAKANAQAEKKQATEQRAAQRRREEAKQAIEVRQSAVPSPEPTTASRSKWVTYGVSASAALFLLAAMANQMTAVTQMKDANTMSFQVQNKLEPTQVIAKKKQYDDKVSNAQQLQGNALMSAAVGLAFSGWAAYRLLTPDPGLATKAATSSLRLAPSWSLNARGSSAALRLEGRF